MTDIFLSYASDDRNRIGPLVTALSHLNFSVWWDRDITVGKRWDVVLEDALNSAKGVVVVWSTRSTSSQWVSNEASEGIRRGVLLPVLIDYVQIPLGFKHLQAANLVGWKGDVDNPEFRQLCHGVWSLTRNHQDGQAAAADAAGHRANFSGPGLYSPPFSDTQDRPIKTPPEFSPPPQTTEVTSDNVAGGLCYLLGPLSLALLIAGKFSRSKSVRFQAFQSSLLFVAWLILACLSSAGWNVFFFAVFFLVFFSIAIATFVGRTVKVPLIHKVAEKLV